MGKVLAFKRPAQKPPAERAPSYGEMGPDPGPYAGGFYRCKTKVLELLHSWSMAERVDHALINALQTEIGEMKP